MFQVILSSFIKRLKEVDFETIIKYIRRLAPSISYKKIMLFSLILIAVIELTVLIINIRKNVPVRIPRISLYPLIFYTNFLLRLTVFGRKVDTVPSANMKAVFELNEVFSVHGILNMILFMPFGFLLLLVFKRSGMFIQLLETMFVTTFLTMAIEIVQLSTKSGRFEINDIVCNTLGGCIGAIAAVPVKAIYLLIKKKMSEKRSIQN